MSRLPAAIRAATAPLRQHAEATISLSLSLYLYLSISPDAKASAWKIRLSRALALMPSGWLCRVIVWLGTFFLLSAI